MATNIYEMRIHEAMNVHISQSGYQAKCLRVPAGWIYIFSSHEGLTSTFVPLASPEKQPNNKEL